MRERAVLYCIVPRDLALKLHAPLRRHFDADPDVEVVVERRAGERRDPAERRAELVPGALAASAPEHERRRIRAETGRRVADRRGTTVEVEAVRARLPRRVRPHAERIVFVERVEPTTQQAEDIDTAHVVARFQAGDRSAFEVIYMRYFERIYSYARIALGDASDAEAAAQEIFLSALESLPRYERRAQPFRAWLFTLARNRVVSELRRRDRLELVDPYEFERRRDAAVADGGGELAVLDWVSDRELYLFVERLPLAQRQVLVLRFMVGLSAVEIAEVLGRSPDAVRMQQARALRFLRARLEALGREPKRPNRARARLLRGQAPVLRARRFGLISPGPVM